MLQLSYSSVQYFFECGCPAAWKFRQQMNPLAKNEFAERGILVHSMMEGTVPPDSVEDKQAKMLYEKMLALQNTLGLDLGESEVAREIKLNSKVNWKARVDRLAKTGSGKPIIIDYKTTGNGWKSVENGRKRVVPMLGTFQGIGYTLPELGKDWPREVWFLVVGFRGPGEVYIYKYSKKDHDNLLNAIALITTCKDFPKVEGKHCLNNHYGAQCEYFEACHGVTGWKKLYKFRK